SLFEKLATYLAEVQEADFAVTIAEPHETFHELLEAATGAPHDEDQNQILWKKFMNFLKAQSAKARIKNPTAVALAFQSLHKRITSSKVKLRYLKRNFNNNALTSDIEQARAEDLLPNVIQKHEEAEVRDVNTGHLICAVYRNRISKETLDFMFKSVLLIFQECSKLVEDVAKLLEEHDLPRLDDDKYRAKEVVNFNMPYRGTAIHLSYQLDLCEAYAALNYSKHAHTNKNFLKYTWTYVCARGIQNEEGEYMEEEFIGGNFFLLDYQAIWSQNLATKTLREQSKVLASFLKAEKQKKKTINKEKSEAADKEGEEAIGKNVIDGEEDEVAEVEGETAEVKNETAKVEDGFNKKESVVESKKGEITDEDDEKKV
ncbi:11042_t:CDS:2, partial [Ambispora gerdemannii]